MSKFNLLTVAELMAEIPLLASDAASVQTRIHVAGCSALDHIRDCGDTRGFAALLNALPNGQRVRALGHWARVYSSGKVIPKLDKATGVWSIDLSKSRKDEDFKIDEAMETSFADLTAERDPVSVSLDSFVRNMVRMSTNNDTHENGTRKVSIEARDAASAVVAFLTEKGFRKVA